MPKQHTRESALHDWVCDLPFMQQALLMLATRGPDGIGKYSATKRVIRFLRGTIIKAAADLDDGKTEYDDFMAVDYSHWVKDSEDFFDDWDNLNMHFLLHLVHAAEVIGYKHPNAQIRHNWNWFYRYSCKCFHMNVETEEQLDYRLDI